MGEVYHDWLKQDTGRMGNRGTDRQRYRVKPTLGGMATVEPVGDMSVDSSSGFDPGPNHDVDDGCQ